MKQTRIPRRGYIRVGCSGWNYNHWRGRFYPEKLPSKRWFDFYVKFFDTVEINNTFYHLPSVETFQAWRTQAPDEFLYAVKANRYLTHMRKLREVEEPLKRFLDRVSLLGEHLGPILYQLPPHWHLNLDRLESFLGLLPSGLPHVFEFREQDWLVEEVFSLLESRRVSLCAHDMPGLIVPRRAVGPIVYVRFHGADVKYQGRYPEPTLRSWWSWMKKQVMVGRDVFVYFNNDAEAHAVRDALRLKRKSGLLYEGG